MDDGLLFWHNSLVDPLTRSVYTFAITVGKLWRFDVEVVAAGPAGDLEGPFPPNIAGMLQAVCRDRSIDSFKEIGERWPEYWGPL